MGNGSTPLAVVTAQAGPEIDGDRASLIWAGDGSPRRGLQLVAFGSLCAASVHASICPEHFREATVFGVFFVVLATWQLLWAGLIVARPSRRLLVAGAFSNLATVGVWAVSRTTGTPFGPAPWRPEPVGSLDVLTCIVELAVAVGVFRLVARGMSRDISGSPTQFGTRLRQDARNLRALLPAGGALPDEVWTQRHKWIVAVLWLHAPGVFAFALFRGQSLVASLGASAIVVVFGLGERMLHNHRRVSTVETSIGLLTCSAVLVYLSGGSIEMHFHYFVMVGVITLYQDWWPFLVAIGYVVLQHGVAGALDPSAVYDHQSAINHPWEWAGIHGVFILAMSAAGIASWRLNESFLIGVVERQEQLEEAQEVAHLGGWERNITTGKGVWSAETYRLLGLDPAKVGPELSEFLSCVHPDDRSTVEAGLAATYESGTPLHLDVRVLNPSGIRWLHCRAKASAYIDGRPSVVSGTVQEITDRKHAEADVHQTLSLLSATLDATADGILVVDTEGKITSFNRRFAELWRVPERVLSTGDDDVALAFLVEQVADPDGFVAKIRELYAQPEAESEDLVEFRDGRTFERFSTPQRVDGTTVGRVWSFRDVSQQKRLERELSHQAFHDSLTGLANQALFRDRVDHALVRSARHGTRVGVLFLDLDNFKTVNDSLGHTAGDELLVAVAERLRASLRATDTAARLGGDEFAVLVEDLENDEEVTNTAERIKDALQQPFVPGGREIFISASIGIAFGSSGSSSDQLLRNGDLAMYTAKREGKNRSETYRAEMHATAVVRLEMEADMRRGLTSGQFQVEYQPIVTIASREIVGVEALVRWQHPDRGLLLPGEFIPLAEETGLIRELGRQVLAEACAQTRRWQVDIPAASGLRVSVNVSARQLHHEDLLPHVKLALDRSGLAPSSLVLELTETAMMNDTEATIDKLHQLKALGVRLAIDDFGTGYSSLSYLQRFPIDVLKIDRAFVSGDGPHDQQSSLTSAIVSLARVLGLQAIAEGIETEAQADTLASLGCVLAQGFHFSRPIRPEVLTALLAAEATGSERQLRLSSVASGAEDTTTGAVN
jgi:diguanylate cyclase (GGDEF)-like protein